MSILAFLSDFGLRDPYVGIVKAVVLSVNPRLCIVDLTHEISPQDIPGGAFVLGTSFSAFPSGTVFLSVVDPGVGSRRAGLVAVSEGFTFVAPDNGLLTLVFQKSETISCYRIEDEALFRHPVSRTFHARDVFAPVAAHLSLGVPPEAVGPAHETPLILPWPEPAGEDGSIQGEVIYIDRFGNLVTNIGGGAVGRCLAGAKGQALVGGVRVPVQGTYSDAAAGAPVALTGSAGFLEISVNLGSAAGELGVGVGEPVLIRRVPSGA
jgi:S-adenosylmethionine hydrolase